MGEQASLASTFLLAAATYNMPQTPGPYEHKGMHRTLATPTSHHRSLQKLSSSQPEGGRRGVSGAGARGSVHARLSRETDGNLTAILRRLVCGVGHLMWLTPKH